MTYSRKVTIGLTALMVTTFGAIFVNWHFSRCTTLCDREFWRASPTVDEIAAELNFLTDVNNTPNDYRLQFFKVLEGSITPLHWAANWGDAATVELLLDAGANVNATDMMNRTPLYFATGRGSDPAIVASLLTASADPNITAPHTIYEAPLSLEVIFGSLEIVSMLVAAGAELEREVDNGAPPLWFALRREDLAFARLLIENGANVHRQGLFYAAVNNGPPGAVALLLEAGADPQIDNVEGIQTGLHGFGSNTNLALLNALLDAGADINIRDRQGRTPLLRAMSNPNPALIRRMVAVGAEMSNPNDWSRGLHSAVSNTQPLREVVELAIDEGADPNYQDRHGRTPLHLLADGGGTEAAAALIAAGADIEALDSNGNTPFLLAIRERNIPMADAYIRLGADAEVTGARGNNALSYATRHGGLPILSWALKQTSNVDPRDDDGNTPLMIAARRTSRLIELLLDAGADANATNTLGQTPLHIATHYGHVEHIRILIAAGANTSAIDNEGSTPKDLASRHQHLRVDQALMEMLSP